MRLTTHSSPRGAEEETPDPFASDRSRFPLKLSGQFLIDRPAVADSHDADHARPAVDGVDDPKAADSVFPQPIEFAQERLPASGIGRNGANGGFDGTFQVGMERPDRFSHVRGDVGAEGSHALRRFLTGVTGSPKTSSKARPFLPDR